MFPWVAVAANPPDAHLEAGLKAFAAADYLRATEELSQSLQVRPSAKVAIYLGNAFIKLGQLGKAKEALEQALQIEPASPRRIDILKLIQLIESRNVGTVKIRSIPAGASIYLDEKGARERGKAPIDLSLPPGKHRIIARLAGHEPGEQEVQVRRGQTTEITLELRARGCDLAVTVAAPVAADGRAAVDGAAAVSVPGQIRVGMGEHRVVFFAAGFQQKELVVRCEGAPLSLSATLVAAPVPPPAPATGLEVAAAVPSLSLSLDGATLLPGKIVAVSAGEHHLRASAPGYRTLSERVRIAPGEVLRTDVQLLRPSWRALGAAVTLTALAVTAEALALAAQAQAEAELPGSPAYGARRDLAIGLHIGAGVMAAGAAVGYVLEYTLARSSLSRRGERAMRIGVQGSALSLAGRF